jgi:hypothetical protein
VFDYLFNLNAIYGVYFDFISKLQVSVDVSLPSQCAKSSVRGRNRRRPIGKCDRKYDDEWCPEKSRTSRGRKRGRHPCSTNKSPTSLPLPVRKFIKVSVRNGGQLQDTDKGIVKEVSNIVQKQTPVKLMSTFADRGCCMVSTMDPYGHILDFLDRSCYFFFQVAPQLYLQG